MKYTEPEVMAEIHRIREQMALEWEGKRPEEVEATLRKHTEETIQRLHLRPVPPDRRPVKRFSKQEGS